MDEDFILRHWSIETINRKLVHGVEFDLMRRGFGSGPEKSSVPVPLKSKEADQLFKEYLPWVSRLVK